MVSQSWKESLNFAVNCISIISVGIHGCQMCSRKKAYDEISIANEQPKKVGIAKIWKE
jgi:hypothetical protein